MGNVAGRGRVNPFAILTAIAQPFIDDWKAKREQQRRVDEAVTANKVRLAESRESHNQAWEMAQLQGADRWLRRASFCMWSAPMLWAVVDADGAERFFRVTLAVLPEWYVYGYLT